MPRVRRQPSYQHLVTMNEIAVAELANLRAECAQWRRIIATLVVQQGALVLPDLPHVELPTHLTVERSPETHTTVVRRAEAPEV